MNQKINKAVLPAAGFGTRFLPVTKALPKEMLPIVDKPVIQYLVEEAKEAGISEITIVTGRGKRAIEDHFDHSWELESTLRKKDKKSILKKVQNIENLANFSYVRQAKPLGDGDAILQSKNIIGNNPFAVFFGDDLIISDKPAISQLEDVFWEKGGQNCIIAIQEVPHSEVSKYGIVGVQETNTEGVFEIKQFVEKPKTSEAPSNLAVVGRYICTPGIFSNLENSNPSVSDGENRLADAFCEILNKGGKIYGVKFTGKRYDTGDKVGFLKATIDFALKDPEMGKIIRDYLV